MKNVIDDMSPNHNKIIAIITNPINMCSSLVFLLGLILRQSKLPQISTDHLHQSTP